MDFEMQWYGDEIEREEALQKELNKIYMRDEAKYQIRKCLYQISISTNKKDKQSAYLELRNQVPLSYIEKIVATSTDNCNLGFIEKNFINSLKNRVILDSQFQIFEDLSWQDLILCMIEEIKVL